MKRNSVFFGRRMLWTRTLLGLFILSAILVESPFFPRSIEEPYVLPELLSLVLVMVAALGKIWATVYLGGRRNVVLVQDGPYSLVGIRCTSSACSVELGSQFSHLKSSSLQVWLFSSSLFILESLPGKE